MATTINHGKEVGLKNIELGFTPRPRPQLFLPESILVATCFGKTIERFTNGSVRESAHHRMAWPQVGDGVRKFSITA